MSGPTYSTDQDDQNLKSKSQYTIFIELIFLQSTRKTVIPGNRFKPHARETIH